MRGLVTVRIGMLGNHTDHGPAQYKGSMLSLECAVSPLRQGKGPSKGQGAASGVPLLVGT